MGLEGVALAACLALFGVPGMPGVPRGDAPSAPSVPSGQGLVCTADWVARLDQPISRTSSFGQFTSGGETGVISCQGTLQGHAVTGPGTYGEWGAFGPGPAGRHSASLGRTVSSRVIRISQGFARVLGAVKRQ